MELSSDDLGLPRWLRRWGFGAWYVIGIGVVLITLGLAISVTRPVAVPLALGAYFAVVLHPIVERLAVWGVPRAVGALLVLLGLLASLVAVGAIIGNTVADEWPELRANIDESVDDVQEWVESLDIDQSLIDRFDSGAGESGGFALEGVGPQVASAASSFAAAVAGTFLGVIVLYYLLKDGRRVSDRLTRIAVQRGRDDVDDLLTYAATAVRRYYASRTALALLNGVSIAAGLALLGVPGAIAVGVVNFVGGYIPYIGAFVGGAFAVVLGFAEGGIGLALVALAVVIVAQVVLENVLEPRLVGSFVHLHPLVVLLVTTLGGVLLGFVGLIVATPTTVVVLQAVKTLRFGDPVPEVDDTLGVDADPEPGLEPDAETEPG